METHAKTLKLRVKDKHAKALSKMARDVNLVWNFLNETSSRSIRERSSFLSSFDLQKYTQGFSKIDGVCIGSTTVQQISDEYTRCRNRAKRSRLNWRVSNKESPKYSLGWIPFKSGAVKFKSGKIRMLGSDFSIWDSYGLNGYQIRGGNFNEDSRGRWYLNICVHVPIEKSLSTASVGVDLGLKSSATTSDGDTMVGRHYRLMEPKIISASRARKPVRTRAIHAKIKNQRLDESHKFSTMLVRRYGAIFVGDISSQKLIKTNMAKSVFDAGWSQFKTMLDHKCHQAGVVFEVVDESYTTQICSHCGSIPEGRPKGIAGLGIREWTCVDCGTAHDRDINAARNILAAGHRRLAVGIPSNSSEEGCQHYAGRVLACSQIPKLPSGGDHDPASTCST
jgi:IS605 OrfB family transposase